MKTAKWPTKKDKRKRTCIEIQILYCRVLLFGYNLFKGFSCLEMWECCCFYNDLFASFRVYTITLTTELCFKRSKTRERHLISCLQCVVDRVNYCIND